MRAKLASQNENKLRELRHAMPGWELELLDAHDPPPEDGATYYENALGKAHITVNKNAVPNDPRPPAVTSGLRLGTPAVTTRGYVEQDCVDLANWMCDVLDAPNDEAVNARVRAKLGRLVSHPHAIDTAVVAGRAVLRGQILASELERVGTNPTATVSFAMLGQREGWQIALDALKKAVLTDALELETSRSTSEGEVWWTLEVHEYGVDVNAYLASRRAPSADRA